MNHVLSRALEQYGRWRIELGAGFIALLASLAVLSIPLTGGMGQLVSLDGDTPALPGPPSDELRGGFTWVNTVNIAKATPSEGIWAGVPVGGISGIDCDRSGCIAISDDSGQRGPVRAYPLDPTTGLVGEPIVLTDAHGVPYRPGTVDPESIRLTRTEPPGMVWSAEGIPTITIADRTGRALDTLPVPTGIEGNHGLEGLAVVNGVDQGQSRIITATELSPRGESHSLVSIYRGDEAVAAFSWPGTGVSEILDADSCDTTSTTSRKVGSPLSLYVLERGYTPGVGNSAVVWQTELPVLSGLSGQDSQYTRGTQPQRMVSREPVLDLAAMLGAEGADGVGNAEALAWWPRPDGTCDLLVGTDNNFSNSQRSVIHILRPVQIR